MKIIPVLQEVCGIIVEIKWMMMQMKIMMLVIAGWIITRHKPVNLLNTRQK